MPIEIYYIESKTGVDHDGLAWIGYIKKSKTGKTIYFNNKALQKIGHSNYFDIETGDKYWISRIKQNGEDRHWSGSGKIMIDRKAVEEYLSYRKVSTLKESKYTIIDIIETKQPSDFYDLENEKIRNE